MATNLPKKGTGSGTQVEISIDDGSTYKKLLSNTKVSPPSFTRSTVDLTDNDSYENNNQMKEFAVSFIEGGDLKIDGWYRGDNTGMDDAEKAFFDKGIVKIKIVSPPWMGKTIVYPGLITELQTVGDMDPENGVPYSITTKVTGKPTTETTVVDSGDHASSGTI